MDDLSLLGNGNGLCRATTCVLIARTGQGTVRMDVLTSLNSDMQTVHLIKPQ